MTPRTHPPGFVLPEALIALALVGLVAVGVAGLSALGARVEREAARLDRGVAAAESVLARLATVSYTRLPEVFGAETAARTATLDTADGTAPADWNELIDELPAGQLSVQLEGLGAGGVEASFGAALALRITARASWVDDGRERAVEVLDVRF